MILNGKLDSDPLFRVLENISFFIPCQMPYGFHQSDMAISVTKLTENNGKEFLVEI